MTLRSLYAVPV